MDDTGGHGELDRARVDDANHVAGSGGLEDAEEWPVAAVFGVQFDDLLHISEVSSKIDRVERSYLVNNFEMKTVNGISPF